MGERASRAEPSRSPDGDLRARMLDVLGRAVIATDPTGRVVYWNAMAERLYGWSAEEAVGRLIGDLTVAPVGQPLAEEIMAGIAAGQGWTGAFPVRRKDGSTFVALVTDSGLFGPDGELEAVVGVSVNLGEALRPYLLDSSEAALVTSPAGLVYFASPAVAGLFGWDEGALVGTPLADLVHPPDRPVMCDSLTAAADAERVVTEFRVRRQDGEPVWVEAHWANLVGDPTIRGLICTLRDISERRAVLDRLSDLALTDALTGLPNRSVLAAQLDHVTARRDHRGALLFLDLDGFKDVNDRLGHAAGDTLLCTVADRLRKALRPEDVCGRWAGDEFMVLAETVASRSDADALVVRVADAVEQPVDVNGVRLLPRVSVGLAMIEAGETADDVVRAADDDMYRVKRAHHGNRPGDLPGGAVVPPRPRRSQPPRRAPHGTGRGV